MAYVRHSFAVAGVLVVLTVAGMPGQQPPRWRSRNYRPVTAERLKNPEAGDWLMVRRTYDGWGYSPLKQITPANVARLQPVWTFATGKENGHEAPPIVNNGVMFVATPGNQVIALDAKTGQLLWRYRRPLPEGVVCCTRRAAAWRSSATKCFSPPAKRCSSRSTRRPATRSGRRRWPTTAGLLHVARAAGRRRQGDGRRLRRRARRPRLRRGATIPRPARSSGGPSWCPRLASPAARPGRRAISGRPAAPRSGSRATTIRRPTSPTGAPATAARGWAISGPATTSTRRPPSPSTSPPADQGPPPIPPERLVGLGRGVAADPGRLPAQRQNHQGADRRRAQRLPVVPRAHRRPHQLRRRQALRGAERVPSLDPKTGRPNVDPARQPGTGKLAEFCPSHWGGKNWPPIAFSPDTRMIYIPANENLCATMVGSRVTYIAGHASPARRPRYMSRRAPITSAKCRPGTSTPASGSGRTRSRPRRTGGRCSPRAAGSCSAAAPTTGSSVPSTRRPARCSGSPDQLRHHRPAVNVHGRRQAVHRRAVGLGHRRAGMQARLNRLSRASIPKYPKAARSGCSRSSSAYCFGPATSIVP